MDSTLGFVLIIFIFGFFIFYYLYSRFYPKRAGLRSNAYRDCQKEGFEGSGEITLGDMARIYRKEREIYRDPSSKELAGIPKEEMLRRMKIRGDIEREVPPMEVRILLFGLPVAAVLFLVAYLVFDLRARGIIFPDNAVFAIIFLLAGFAIYLAAGMIGHASKK